VNWNNLGILTAFTTFGPIRKFYSSIG